MSLLPLGILYIYSDIFYVLIYKVFGYRKKVVWDNLKNCFPEKEEKELIKIQKEFYKHLCDLIIESIKAFSMRRSDMAKRFYCINTNVLLPYFEKGQSVILGFGHYNN
ncbi:MAG: lysophospholipid acyltransferase family protein, partial [Saprospiraceae bacterium]